MPIGSLAPPNPRSELPAGACLRFLSHVRLMLGGGSMQKTSSGTRVRPVRVLVIDEGALVGAELARSLSDHDVVAVECGENALALLGAGMRFDLILCDARLGGMSGAMLLASLRADHPTQADRVVFMTDRSASPIVDRLLDGVSNLCVERPFDMDGLRSLIERRVLTAPTSRTA
jgi:CheY-like chemotaxis protein